MNTSMPTDRVAAAFRLSYQAVIDRTELPPAQLPAVGLTAPSRRPRYGWLVAAATAVAVFAVFAGVALVGGDALHSGEVAGFRAHRSAASGGRDAIVSGVVETDQDTGCVWLSDAEGSRQPVVWPVGTTASSDPIEIVLADGQVVHPGDLVEGGGGHGDADTATEGLGLEPFPRACIHTGEAAIFNADSPITATPAQGLDTAETLVGRFTIPEPIGLELIAVNPNGRSVAVVDFVTGTVHRFEPGQYEAPSDAIDGASGGGGFTHLWASGTISTYWPIDAEPLIYQPEPLRELPGIASTLEVLPAPDGDHTWLVQPGFDDEPTLVELVNVVEFELARLMSTEIEGTWQPVGATVEGLILTGDEAGPRTRLVSTDGTIRAEVPGTALSVGWNGSAVLRPDGSLILTSALLDRPVPVDKPGDGAWVSVGGPIIPAASPPARTGTDRYLVMLAHEPGKGEISAGDLVVVDGVGTATAIYQLREGSHLASWSRDGDWIVVVEDSSVTLVSVSDGSIVPLGGLIPDSHWVLTAG